MNVSIPLITFLTSNPLFNFSHPLAINISSNTYPKEVTIDLVILDWTINSTKFGEYREFVQDLMTPNSKIQTCFSANFCL